MLTWNLEPISDWFTALRYGTASGLKKKADANAEDGHNNFVISLFYLLKNIISQSLLIGTTKHWLFVSTWKQERLQRS